MSHREANGEMRGNFPRGVVAVLCYVSLVTLLVVLDLISGPLRIILVAPLLGFLPGYALLFGLFPATDPYGTPSAGGLEHGLRWAERGALAIGVSVIVLTLVVLLLGSLGVPLIAAPVTLSLFLVSVAGLAVGTIRRGTTHTDGDLTPFDEWRVALRDAILTESRLDAALTVVLLLVVATALTGFAYGLAAPDQRSPYSEVALLDRQGDDLVASGYPTTVVQGQPVELTLSIKNHEGTPTNYTVIAVLERVRTSGDDLVVLEREPLDRRTVTVDDGLTQLETLTVVPSFLGSDLRLSVFVVEGPPPDRVTATTADHHLYLWIDVSATPTTVESASVGDSRLLVENH